MRNRNKRIVLKTALGSGFAIAGIAAAATVSACGAGGWQSTVQIVVSDSTSTLADQSFSESVYNGVRDFFNKDVYTDGSNPMPQNANSTDIAEGNGIWKKPGSDDDARINTYRSVVSDGSKIVVTSGFNQQTALQKVVSTDPSNESVKSEFADEGFVFIDGSISGNGYDPTNLASISYRADNGSFLVGLATAVYLNEHWDWFYATKPSTIGVSSFVGQALPSTTSYFNGFRMGLEYWNQISGMLNVDVGANAKSSSQTDTSAIKMKWIGSKASNESTMSMDEFASQSFDATELRATTLTNAYLNNGAKVIFPIAGPQTQLVLAAVQQNNNSNAAVVGVDTAQEDNDSLTRPMPNQTMAPGQDIIPFSSLKALDYSTEQVLNAIRTGKESNGYFGFGWSNTADLGNNGVGISPAGYQYLIDPLFFTSDIGKASGNVIAPQPDSSPSATAATSADGTTAPTTYDVSASTSDKWNLSQIMTGTSQTQSAADTTEETPAASTQAATDASTSDTDYAKVYANYTSLLNGSVWVKTKGTPTYVYFSNGGTSKSRGNGDWTLTGDELFLQWSDDTTNFPAINSSSDGGTVATYSINDVGGTASKQVATSNLLDGTGWDYSVSKS